MSGFGGQGVPGPGFGEIRWVQPGREEPSEVELGPGEAGLGGSAARCHRDGYIATQVGSGANLQCVLVGGPIQHAPPSRLSDRPSPLTLTVIGGYQVVERLVGASPIG